MKADAFRYDGKRALVVGGATGMGAAVAELVQDLGAEVIVMDYAPVTLAGETIDRPRGRHFLAASRLVPYKNNEAIVDAFRHLPDLQLVVAGDGPEADRLRQRAGPNVTFRGFVGDGE